MNHLGSAGTATVALKLTLPYTLISVTSSSGKSTRASEWKAARNSARIEHVRRPDHHVPGHMRMAVTNQVVAAAGHQLAQQTRIVAVHKGDPLALQLQLAAPLVADGAGRSSPAAARSRLSSQFPNTKWVGQGANSRRLDRADVATMNHLLHLAAFQHRHGLAREGQSARACRSPPRFAS